MNSKPKLDPEIFRAYDIRGQVDRNLSAATVRQLGRALAAEALALGHRHVTTGRDGRTSGPSLHQALNQGLTDGGVHVVDIGLVPTPVLYFAVQGSGEGAGIMVTGSHNPADYNGLKMVLNGRALTAAAIQGLRHRVERSDFTSGQGQISQQDFTERYIEEVVADAGLNRPLKVVADCGNGAAGAVVPALLRQLGCELVELFCEVDGSFPNHHPDPAEPKNLKDLIQAVQCTGADCGLAFDGDGDRLGFVTNSGDIIYPDRLLMLFAEHILRESPGAEIVFDVKCSRFLSELVRQAGGRPCMWRTGHSHIKAKLRETGAPLGGEFSGHICFADRWYGFDDALYAAARVLELLSIDERSAEQIFQALPTGLSTPEIKVEADEGRKFQIIEELANQGDFGDGERTDIDGLRVDYPDGWGLIRASNTSPMLTLRFEADQPSTLERIQRIFQTQLNRISPNLSFQSTL